MGWGSGIDAPQKKQEVTLPWKEYGFALERRKRRMVEVGAARMEILYSGGRGKDGGTKYRRSRRSVLIARWREKEKGRRFSVSDGAALLLSEVDDVVVR